MKNLKQFILESAVKIYTNEDLINRSTEIKTKEECIKELSKIKYYDWINDFEFEKEADYDDDIFDKYRKEWLKTKGDNTYNKYLILIANKNGVIMYTFADFEPLYLIEKNGNDITADSLYKTSGGYHQDAKSYTNKEKKSMLKGMKLYIYKNKNK